MCGAECALATVRVKAGRGIPKIDLCANCVESAPVSKLACPQRPKSEHELQANRGAEFDRFAGGGQESRLCVDTEDHDIVGILILGQEPFA
jgi:hypothetical protein